MSRKINSISFLVVFYSKKKSNLLFRFFTPNSTILGFFSSLICSHIVSCRCFGAILREKKSTVRLGMKSYIDTCTCRRYCSVRTGERRKYQKSSTWRLTVGADRTVATQLRVRSLPPFLPTPTFLAGVRSISRGLAE